MENFKPKKYEDHLMSAFACDEGDIETNKAGYLSRRQHDRLRRQRQQATSIWTLVVLLELLGFAFILPMAFTGYPIQLITSPLFFMVLIGLLGVYFGYRAYNYGADLNENRVDSVEGTIDLTVSAAQYTVAYLMTIDTLRFTLTKAQYSALKNGDPYRVYYTRYSKKVLAVEWLRDGEDNLLAPDEINAAAPSPSLMNKDEQASLSNRR